MPRRVAIVALTGSLLAILIAGCAAEEDRVTVRGQVRFHGQALRGGTIAFAPDADRSTSRQLAVGQIKADGSYQLQTDNGLTLAPGWYRVSVTSSPGYWPKLPDKYRDPLQSGLDRQVQPGQQNVLDFDLK